MLSDEEMVRIIMDGRLHDPGLPARMARSRKLLSQWPDRALVLVAADHPGRRTVAAGSDSWAMANRADLLRRVARVLMQPCVDGILVTPDLMEELWYLQSWVLAEGGPDFLTGKILIGSMNRAGLSDTVFEFRDFVSAYDANALAASGMDAGKLLLRVDPENKLSSYVLEAVVQALRDLHARSIPAFLEPIPVPLTTDELVRLMGVASALGPSSCRRWIKVPMTANFKRVSAATTCPLVLLGGSDLLGFEELRRRIHDCLSAGPNIRGILMGRNALYPAERDPRDFVVDLASWVTGEPRQDVVIWPLL
ncbi:MAG: aldolase [Firmicutes bacterium]|nr:aldolase [Bacillota bacterium]